MQNVAIGFCRESVASVIYCDFTPESRSSEVRIDVRCKATAR
jgi:hypothetical protein